MNIIFIAAMSENRVLGREGKLPWHLPNDLRQFKKLTLGKNVLMGRKTYESLQRPLPNRNNYVLTKSGDGYPEQVGVFHSKAEVLTSNFNELFVIGGEEIFRLFLPDCQKIYLTLVHAVVAGDAYFPEFKGFIEINRENFESDEKHLYKYSFIEYMRPTHHVLP